MAFLSEIKNALRWFFKSLVRRKKFDDENLTNTKLDRCLSTLDLTLLGVGSTLGLGIYVLAGQVASSKAGPSVVISFFISAIASVFAGLCYAEFGARVPRAGSAYVYSYVTVGEFMAFIIGWNLILEYVIGTASVARGYSGYLDSLFDNTIQKHLEKYMPMHLAGMSAFPDFLSLGITLLLTIMLAIGVKESTRFNNVFTGLNLLVVVYVVVTGSFKADIHNWNLKSSEVPLESGEGGFFPYGFSGVMAGAAMCFYGYVGFDCIATTGEEVKNPQKSIPISIILSLLIVFLAYCGVSAVQTLMWPYFDQDQPAPLPYVFQKVGWPVAKWIISIGALAGLSTSLLGAMFPLPRVLYAMANDGVIFRFLADVHPRFKTPLLATILSGIFAGVMAMMFNVHELAAMMSIGTLLAYTLVATSVLILRCDVLNSVSSLGKCNEVPRNFKGYKIKDERILMTHPVSTGEPPSLRMNEESERIASTSLDVSCNAVQDIPINRNLYRSSSTSAMFSSTQHYTTRDALRQIFNLDKVESQTPLSSKVSLYLIGILSALLLLVDLLLVMLEDYLFHLDVTTIICVSLVLIIIIVLVIALGMQPSDTQKVSFKVPFVPVIPIISIFVNIYLMLNLSNSTWIRFGVWMAIGFFIYFSYGIRNSSEQLKRIRYLPVISESEDTEDDVKKTENSPLLIRKS